MKLVNPDQQQQALTLGIKQQKANLAIRRGQSEAPIALSRPPEIKLSGKHLNGTRELIAPFPESPDKSAVRKSQDTHSIGPEANKSLSEEGKSEHPQVEQNSAFSLGPQEPAENR